MLTLLLAEPHLLSTKYAVLQVLLYILNAFLIYWIEIAKLEISKKMHDKLPFPASIV